MPYATKYHLQFTNQLNENYYIFFNKKDYTGDITFLTGASGVLSIKSLNGDDDVFSPILSKECTIGIFINKEEDVDITDFLAESDDDYNIIIHRELEQQPIFGGFLLVEDSSQPLYDKPFQITLRASDGLALLKGIPLTTAIGENFTGLNTITNYIGAALQKANADISFKFYSDIYHVTMDRLHCPLHQMQLQSRTFEKSALEFDNCYSVLEKILTDLQCSVFYESGFWHIVSRWQYHKDYGFNYWTFIMLAGTMVEQSYNDREVVMARIGEEELIYAINKDAVEYYKVATKSVKKTFIYDIPAKLLVNQDLKEGTLITGSGGSTGEPPNQIFYEDYTLPGWTNMRTALNVGTPLASPAIVRREFDAYNYEKDRYMILFTQTNNPNTAFIASSTFPIGQYDRISITVESKHKNNYSSIEGSLIFAVILRGDNGINYTLDDNTVDGEKLGPWAQLGSLGGNLKVIERTYQSGDDRTEWVTTTVDSMAAPVTGTIQIVMSEYSSNSYPNETWFRPVQITYNPYVNNSYRPARGDFNIFSQDVNINKTVDETVYISDSPKQIIKGAIFVNNLLATPEWYRIDYPDERARFTQIMAITKYNFVFRQFKKIEGSLKGLSLSNTSGENIPFGFLPQYYFSDIPNQPTTKFILTSLEIDYHAATWRGVLVSVQVNSTESYDTYDFQYLFQ